MRGFITTALAIVFLCGSAVAVLTTIAGAAADEQQAILQADHALVHAFAGADKAEVNRLLDVDFSWISTDGRNQSREDVLRALPNSS